MNGAEEIIDDILSKIIEFAKSYHSLHNDKMYEDMMYIGQQLNRLKLLLNDLEKKD